MPSNPVPANEYNDIQEPIVLEEEERKLAAVDEMAAEDAEYMDDDVLLSDEQILAEDKRDWEESCEFEPSQFLIECLNTFKRYDDIFSKQAAEIITAELTRRGERC